MEENKNRNIYITKVMELTGLKHSIVRNKMKEVREKYGITFKEYVLYKLYKYEIDDVEFAYNKAKRIRTRRKHNQDRFMHEVMDITGWNEQYTKDKMRTITKRYNLTYYEYKKYQLYLFNDDELVNKIEEIKIEKQKKKEVEEIENNAKIARRKFILEHSEIEEAKEVIFDENKALVYRNQDEYDVKNTIYNREGDKQPKPIIAACCYLGQPLPKNAVCKYQPSSYLDKIDGSLESIRLKFGSDLIPETEQTEEEYRIFVEKFKGNYQTTFNETDLAIYYVDYIFFNKDYGYLVEETVNDYFNYHFYQKEIDIRRTFLSRGYSLYIKKICNSDISYLMDKGKFNSFYKDVVHRDFLDVTKCTKKDFVFFVDKHPVFFAKPITGTGGKGAGIVDLKDKDKEEAYATYKDYIVEEVVVQHPDMASFNPDTVNTLRVYGLTDADGIPHVLGALARFGRVGAKVDNFHCGGVCCIVDVSTGIIENNAVDIMGKKYKEHPDSLKPFVGFKIPYWDQVVEEIKKAMVISLPINQHIGWDVSITKEGKVEMIEGNSIPNFDVLQSDQIGKTYIYDQYIPALAYKNGFAPYTIEDISLTIK